MLNIRPWQGSNFKINETVTWNKLCANLLITRTNVYAPYLLLFVLLLKRVAVIKWVFKTALQRRENIVVPGIIQKNTFTKYVDKRIFINKLLDERNSRKINRPSPFTQMAHIFKRHDEKDASLNVNRH